MNIFSGKFFTDKKVALRPAVFMLADAFLIVLSVLASFLVRFEGRLPERYLLNIGGIVVLALFITLPIFYFSKLYHFSWNYVSSRELFSLMRGTVLSFLILTALFFIMRDHPIFSGFPRSTLFIAYFFIFIFCGALRLAKRIYFEVMPGRGAGKKERTLIAGAGNAGEQILRNILSSSSSPYLPVGFIDDNSGKQKILIHGITVLGKIEDIPRLVKEKKVETLIVALPSAGSPVIRRAVEWGRKAGLRKIKIIPAMEEIVSGRVKIGTETLQEMEMEDLLGREPVILDQKLIDDFIKDKMVLVTGAAGSIGSELCRQIAKFNPSKLVMLDQDETGIFNIAQEMDDKFPGLDKTPIVADVRNKEKIKIIFKNFQPKIIFHAAAYKHVPLMEKYPDEAVENNVLGTLNLVGSAITNEVEKFIFISTDKAVNPSSVMGATKRLGEMICQFFNDKNRTKFISVRFGNVLGSRGSIIPIFLEKIKNRQAIEITHPDMERYFMTIPEACLLVMEAGAMGQGGEVFVLDMGDPIRIKDLAEAVIRLSGLEPDKDVPIVYTQPRPGEKFFEELLTAEEGTIATQNKKIYMANLSKSNLPDLILELDKLKKAVNNGESSLIRKVLKEIIPSYHAQ